jgi:hypothetical protein
MALTRHFRHHIIQTSLRLEFPNIPRYCLNHQEQLSQHSSQSCTEGKSFLGSLRRHFFTFSSNVVSRHRRSTQALLTIASPPAQVARHVPALSRACTYDLSPLSTCTCNLIPSRRITLLLSRLLTCLENFDHTQPSNHSRSPQDYLLRNKIMRLAPLNVL